MELTEEHMLKILPRLRERDLHELAGVLRDPLEQWAAQRVRDPGVHYAFLYDGEVVAVGGVLEGAAPGVGSGWALAVDGWWRVLEQAMHVWSLFIKHGGYRRLECRCYADNEKANSFARRLGFKLEGTLKSFTVRGEDINQYGMVIGG